MCSRNSSEAEAVAHPRHAELGGGDQPDTAQCALEDDVGPEPLGRRQHARQQRAAQHRQEIAHLADVGHAAAGQLHEARRVLLPEPGELLPDVDLGHRVHDRQAGVGHRQPVTRRDDQDVVSGRAQCPGQRHHREDMPHARGRNYENAHDDSPIENGMFSIFRVGMDARERNVP
jgi:hypothetical protein